ncbi:TNT domain-containing protein [Gordonia terrae]
MKRRHALLAIFFSLALAVSGGGVAAAAPNPLGSLDFGSLGGPVMGGCSKELVNGNRKLGPKTLATDAPVGPQLAGYHRFLGKDPNVFLALYATGDGWNWPPKDGYVLNPDGSPKKAVTTLDPNTPIDRYGPASGRFLAPAGTPYKNRALPPENLVDEAKPEFCNYHAYVVKRPVQVYTGPIAEGFGQPGGGIQYQIDQQLLEPVFVEQHRGCFNETGGFVNTQWLLCSGVLESVFPG